MTKKSKRKSCELMKSTDEIKDEKTSPSKVTTATPNKKNLKQKTPLSAPAEEIKEIVHDEEFKDDDEDADGDDGFGDEVDNAVDNANDNEEKEEEVKEIESVVGYSNTEKEEMLADHKERIKQRDGRTLFVKNLPPNIKVDQVKELSSDILFVRSRIMGDNNQKISSYVFLEFANEEIAEKNFSILQGKKINDKEIYVDYLGSKSKVFVEKHPSEIEPELDFTKLYVNGFSRDTTIEELKPIFPKSIKIDLPVKKKGGKGVGYAFVLFENEHDAKEAYSNSQNSSIQNNFLTILYSKKPTSKKKRSADQANISKANIQNPKKSKEETTD